MKIENSVNYFGFFGESLLWFLLFNCVFLKCDVLCFFFNQKNVCGLLRIFDFISIFNMVLVIILKFEFKLNIKQVVIFFDWFENCGLVK